MKNFLKKIKAPLISLLAAATITGVVTPLAASCSANTEKRADPGDFDKTYKVDEVMYKKLLITTQSAYRTKLRIEGVPEEERTKLLEESQKKLDSFRDDAFADTKAARTTSFTAKTNAVIDFARDELGVDVERTFSENPVNWTKECETVYTSAKNNLKQTMVSMGLTSNQIQLHLKTFGDKFNSLSQHCFSEFSDKLRGLVELKSQIALCADEINSDISFMAAHTVLSNFFKTHQIRPKNIKFLKSHNIYWNLLKQDSSFTNNGKFGNDISKFIEDNFEVVDLKRKTTEDIELKKMINNYVLIPTLKGMTENPKTNVYKLKIDWGLISVSNLNKSKTDSNIAHLTTAHRYKVNDIKAFDKYNSVNKYRDLPDKEKQFDEYTIPVSASFERQKLNETYLSKIQFKWDDTADPDKPDKKYALCKYEMFFGDANNPDEPGVVHLLLNQLGEAGLCICYTNPKGQYTEVPLNYLSNDKTWFFSTDDIGKLFVDNCNIVSKTQVINDETHEVSNRLFVSYNNSPHEATVCKSLYNSENDQSKFLELGKEDTFNCKGFPISPDFARKARDLFLDADAFVLQLANNPFKTSLADVKTTCVLTTVFNAFACLVLGITIAKALLPVPRTPFAIVTAIFAGIVIGINATITTLMWTKCYTPLKDGYDKVEKIIKSDAAVKLTEMIDHDGEEYFKDLEKLTKFQKLPFSKAREIFYRYKCFNQNENFKALSQQLKDEGIDPDGTIKKVNKTLETIGFTEIPALILNLIPFFMSLHIDSRPAEAEGVKSTGENVVNGVDNVQQEINIDNNNQIDFDINNSQNLPVDKSLRYGDFETDALHEAKQGAMKAYDDMAPANWRLLIHKAVNDHPAYKGMISKLANNYKKSILELFGKRNGKVPLTPEEYASVDKEFTLIKNQLKNADAAIQDVLSKEGITYKNFEVTDFKYNAETGEITFKAKYDQLMPTNKLLETKYGKFTPGETLDFEQSEAYVEQMVDQLKSRYPKYCYDQSDLPPIDTPERAHMLLWRKRFMAELRDINLRREYIDLDGPHQKAVPDPAYNKNIYEMKFQLVTKDFFCTAEFYWNWIKILTVNSFKPVAI